MRRRDHMIDDPVWFDNRDLVATFQQERKSPNRMPSPYGHSIAVTTDGFTSQWE